MNRNKDHKKEWAIKIERPFSPLSWKLRSVEFRAELSPRTFSFLLSFFFVAKNFFLIAGAHQRHR